MSDLTKTEITSALRAYILAEDTLRRNPQSWQSRPYDPATPEGSAYQRQLLAARAAEAELWMATDLEYAEDGFYDVVWAWRYWNVMARKCCWFQRFGTTYRAGRTMRKLHQAEARLAEVCGLTDIYRSPCSYIEEMFPKLRGGDADERA